MSQTNKKQEESMNLTAANLNRIKNARRIVIKVGTSTLTHANGKLDLRHINMLCQVISDLANSGKEMILVTSGAIGVGMGKLNQSTRPEATAKRQALAAVGQCELMFIYDRFFGEFNNTVAQVLLTADVLSDPATRRNAANTFQELLALGVIPVVNENDTVSTLELEGQNIGDNDTLSAHVAELAGADFLLILTDIDGLYTANPQTDPAAKLIPTVSEITEDTEKLAGSAGTKLGTGGMVTKLRAARIAMNAGIPCCVTKAEDPETLYRIFEGEQTGTLFLAK